MPPVCAASQPVRVISLEEAQQEWQCIDPDNDRVVYGIDRYTQPTTAEADDWLLPSQILPSSYAESQPAADAQLPMLVHRITRFRSPHSEATIMQWIKDALTSLSLPYTVRADNSFRVETLDRRGKSLRFVARILAKLHPNYRIVEFRRQNGDGLAFKALYRIIKEKLRPIVG